jgi:hypothetical protein
VASLSAFLQTLAYTGRGVVGALRPWSAAELRESEAVLVELESHVRLDMPGKPPPLDLAAALWGATMLYRACQLAVYRDLGADVIERELKALCPTPITASAHYSVDLALRYLPQAFQFAQRASEDDALVTALRRIGQAWPLSSVGMQRLPTVNADALVAHPSLLALYVDRILSAKDTARLADQRVREAVAAALGMHPTLAADMAAKVAELQNEIVFLAESVA